MWALRRSASGAPILLLSLPLLGVARLLPAHGFGLWLRLVAASLVFGAAHLDNGPHAPDWRYGVLASLAGLAYGWVYLRTRRILAPAIAHTLVDVTWSLFFKG